MLRVKGLANALGFLICCIELPLLGERSEETLLGEVTRIALIAKSSLY